MFYSGPSADKKIEAKIKEFKKEGVLEYSPEELARIKEEERKAELGFMTSMAQKARPVMKAALFAAALSFSSLDNKKASAQGNVSAMDAGLGGGGPYSSAVVLDKPSGSESAKERVIMDNKIEDPGEKGSWVPEDVDIHWSSPVREKSGEIRTFEWSKDWWKVFAPAFAEAKWENKTEVKTTTNVPYEYARKFAKDEKAGQSLRQEDHDRLQKYVQNQLEKSLADKIYALGIETAEGVYGAHHEPLDTHNLEIKSIKVTGFASPEGPRQEGAETLNKEDPKNIELAGKRAEAGMEKVIESLKGMGFNDEQINSALQKSEGVELDLAGEDIKKLSEKSKEYPGANNTEQIWSMVMDYNDNKITDPETLRIMDEVFANKRKIQVEIEYEGKRETVVSLPLPLLLLAMLYPLARLLRRGQNGNPMTMPTTPPTTPPQNETIPTFTKPNIPELVRQTWLPKAGTPEYENMEEEAIANDLYLFWGKDFLDERGLSYPTIAGTLKANFDQFKDDGERIDYLTIIILKNWRDADIEARREAGLPEERLEEGLDYENQPEQIKWAKMHAIGILDVIKTKDHIDRVRGGNSGEYIDHLQDKVFSLNQRRRKAGRPAFTRMA